MWWIEIKVEHDCSHVRGGPIASDCPFCENKKLTAEIEQLQKYAVVWLSVEEYTPKIGYRYLVYVANTTQPRVTERFFAAKWDGCPLSECYWLSPHTGGQQGLILQSGVTHFAEIPKPPETTKDADNAEIGFNDMNTTVQADLEGTETGSDQ